MIRGSYIYTQEQIRKFYKRINFPQKYIRTSVADASPEEQLDFLCKLQKYTLCAIPFENLSIHYSPHHSISIHPDALFSKIVESSGRGGYCMENSALFAAVLKSLGYKFYSAGARVRTPAGYEGWSHHVNIVTIGQEKFFVDIGFGPNGQTRPLKLPRLAPDEHDAKVFTQIAPAQMRLVKKNIEENTDPEQRLWVYQHRINESSEWADTYCFTELEFLPNDYILMNYWTSSSPKTMFTQKIICTRMMMADDGSDEIVGALILGKELKRRMKGDTTTIWEFESEEDRVMALEMHYGITFSEAEKAGIDCMSTELGA